MGIGMVLETEPPIGFTQLSFLSSVLLCVFRGHYYSSPRKAIDVYGVTKQSAELPSLFLGFFYMEILLYCSLS